MGGGLEEEEEQRVGGGGRQGAVKGAVAGLAWMLPAAGIALVLLAHGQDLAPSALFKLLRRQKGHIPGIRRTRKTKLNW